MKSSQSNLEVQSSDSIVLNNLTSISPKETHSLIRESKSVTDILSFCSYRRSLVAFDLDNTLIRPTHMEDLGSEQWFSALLNYALEEIQDPNQAKLLAITLSDLIQPLIKVTLVEKESADIIKRLRATHTLVMGVTARGFNIADATLQQLDTVGVYFSDTSQSAIKLIVSDPNKKVYVKSGIIFCDGADKGECLQKYFQTIGKCYDIIMVDDTKKNLLRVRTILKKNKHSFVGLRYSVMDQRAQYFSMFRAMTKYIQIKDSLPDEARKIVTRLKLVEESKSESWTRILRQSVRGTFGNLF